MNKTTHAVFLASALLFSAGAMAQSGGTGGAGGAGGSGSPTQGMEKDADKAHMNDGKAHTHKDKKAKHSSSSSSTDSVSPVMQRTPDGKTPTPDATVPAGK